MISDKKNFHSFFQKILYAAFAVIIISLSFLINVLKTREQTFKKKVYPDVYVNSQLVSGKTVEEVRRIFDKKNENIGKNQILIYLDNEAVATFSGSQLNIRYDSKGIAERAYLIGRSSNTTTKLYQNISALFHLQAYHFAVYPEYRKDSIREFILDIEERYNKPAKNALFSFDGGRVQSFRQEERGARIDSESFMKEVDEKIHTLKETTKVIKISIKKEIVEPEISLAKANSFGIEEFLAEGKSDFTHSMAERIHNVILATSKFNGVLIPRGETFSFNEAIGDISVLTGYQPAYIIKNGRTVLGDGGGVCQVSTTLFRAALNAGLPIVERSAHAYRVSYYENDAKPGFDATVFAPSTDLKIKNDTSTYILIQTEVDEVNNLLYFRLYGKKDGRTVQISTPTLTDVAEPPPPLNQDDPTLKRGVVKQVDFPAWGGKASFDYTVKKADGTTTTQTFFSVYKPWQAVFLVGTAD